MVLLRQSPALKVFPFLVLTISMVDVFFPKSLAFDLPKYQVVPSRCRDFCRELRMGCGVVPTV